ncbi:hypothetical protein SAMN05660748_0154 [Blastococcus aggregatus]|uniref:Uncharacterized protein n=1 Tax=Blastococcus aggregatus TaxID=38502 RepID=A0A285UX85_9ACTN|nr:hypothetical protein [Blastococcus aggregatus]SOC46297.1 hypothetical protein SAMN05660748_0154 [Blastococcus aggregatus]
MTHSPRSAAPRSRWRSAALGSLLAVAAIALGLVVAPAAVAGPAPSAAPNLGSVRHLEVDVDVQGTAPLGLQLSGAAIRFASATTTGTCRTQALGQCDVRWASNGKLSGSGTASLSLPAGTYTVTQVADQPVPGLQPKAGTLATVTICDCWHSFWGVRLTERSGHLAVPNASLYRHTITARVVDRATGDPVRDARYRLTGPGFPGLLGNPAVWDAGVERSSRTGELTFTTMLRAPIFRPGTWTLTPVDVPEPYVAADLPVELTAAAPGGNTWRAGEVELSVPAVPLPPATGSATLALQIDGPAPADLDLAGVEFELTGPGADPTTTPCVTDAAGSCSIRVVPDVPGDDVQIEGAAVVLPVGTYAVRQATAPVGLTPAVEIAPLELCVAPTPEGCVTSRTIPNVSTYRTRAEIQVLSGNGPVAGTEVTLTGPGFPATSARTDEDGRGAWSGWFRPGEWSFAVDGQPAPLLMTMEPGRGDTSLPWRIEITLPSVEQPEVTDPTPTTTPAAPTTSAAPSPTSTPNSPDAPSSGAPTATSVPGPAAGPSGEAQPSAAAAPGNGTDAGTGVAAARVVPADEPQEDAAPPTAAAPTTGPAPENPGNGQVFVAADRPGLETESSAQLLSAGLVTGIGIVFVALVLTGYGLLRSRQRRRV